MTLTSPYGSNFGPMRQSFLKPRTEVINVTAREICQATAGQLLAGDPDALISRISTDTRAVMENALFVALKGENFDGGDFVEEALLAGALGAVAESGAAARAAAAHIATSETPAVVIGVEDAGEALKHISSLVARRSPARFVAITGSTGKTSTKDMLFGLLSPQLAAVASKASFNNEVGVPLTLLDLEPDTQVAVVEMGMQKPGEIAGLCRIITPDIAVITNIGPAHLEYSGSLENIARGKAEIAAALPTEGGIVVPYGERLLAPYLQQLKTRVVTFGFDSAADVHLVWHEHQDNGRMRCRIDCQGEEIEVELSFAANYHLLNFMAALGAYSLLGLDPVDAVEPAAAIRLSGMRGERIELGGAVTLLNDCYNANPLSMTSALDYLASVAPGRRTMAILGDMSELGVETDEYHRQVGRRAAELGIENLIAVGTRAQGYIEGATEAGLCRTPGSCHHFADRREAIAVIPELIQPGDVVLLKASRFMKLEEAGSAIIAAQGRAGAGGQSDPAPGEDSPAVAEG